MEWGEVTLVITQEDFWHNWRQTYEKILFSLLGIQFRHYSMATYSNYLPKVYALTLLLITKPGSSPER